jgi:hypothetical protein
MGSEHRFGLSKIGSVKMIYRRPIEGGRARVLEPTCLQSERSWQAVDPIIIKR